MAPTIPTTTAAMTANGTISVTTGTTGTTNRHDRGPDRRYDDRPYPDDRPHPGYRGHHGYRGYDGDNWDNDYGVVSSGIATLTPCSVSRAPSPGAVIGNRTAAPQNRGIATVIGAIAGGIIGSAVGNSIDDGDRACMGHSLELAPIGRPVVWVNPRSRVAWRVVPMSDVSRDCREFDVYRDYRGRHSREHMVACRRDRGYWECRGR
jgi:surface antigen